ncbi:hypothetical protein BBJ41_01095 [Burkholderia stabilis]|uniref:hypothetical protein n=1 Tax=Burkholderia stabilis TaxID=95485 RepID=UPI000851FB28|nr:hypothetical protein [Burkholderia stabilis]AOR66261.1 hypothetical protein BBJ41_01095 [Burkholderia stabilis]HDR9491930.1 hypothetical protein [Burkholderia stabilis]HDR9524036.1 hypothetical protein [Burkholderia stabilis]HDR9530657.1 hypothetical protein [Burkholderia stabilis]HDR9539387.1 hypothetical protein [Burkholderia stabilis]
MMNIDWLTTFNRLYDRATRRAETLHRLRKLQDEYEMPQDAEDAFETVRGYAQGDHRLAVAHAVQYAQHVPLDKLRALSLEAQARLGTRLATLGAQEGNACVLAAGLELGASPYPLLMVKGVLASADLLDLVLARCTAEALNAPSNDQSVPVWETVMTAIPGGDPIEHDQGVALLVGVVLPRLAAAGADLVPLSRPGRRADLFAEALVRYQGMVLGEAVGTGGAERGRRRL